MKNFVKVTFLIFAFAMLPTFSALAGPIVVFGSGGVIIVGEVKSICPNSSSEACAVLSAAPRGANDHANRVIIVERGTEREFMGVLNGPVPAGDVQGSSLQFHTIIPR